jgi:hypothetical protein
VYPCDFLGVKKIKIFSNALACSSYDSFYLGQCNVIQTISKNASSFGLLEFSAQMDSFSKLKQTRINEIDIQLRDEDDSLIDFNGTNWCLTLQLNIVRKLKINVISYDLFDSNNLNMVGKKPQVGLNIPPPPLENDVEEEEEEEPNPDLDELNLLTS